MAETALTVEEIAAFKLRRINAHLRSSLTVPISLDDLDRLVSRAEQHAEMLAVLRSVEWDLTRRCHVCRGHREHRPNCTLCAAIQKAGG